MNRENDNREKDECPLCQSSKEAMDKLNLNKDSGPKTKRSFRKLGMIFLVLAIIFGSFVVYKFLSNPSSGIIKENNPTAKQSAETILEKPQIGFFAPDFVSEDIFGNEIALSDFRGEKPVLLVFWATWCGFCAKELSDLKTFTQRYQDEIQVIAVSSGETKETIKRYNQEKGVNFLMPLDENRKIWNQYLVRGTPSHFLISKEGKIVTLQPGLALIKDLETMFTMLE